MALKRVLTVALGAAVQALVRAEVLLCDSRGGLPVRIPAAGKMPPGV